MHNTIVLLAQAVPEGRVFGLDAQTLKSIGIQLANGIVLAIALAVILYNPVKEFMDKRTETIQKKIEDADMTMTKANELIAEYDKKIEDIDKERLEILETARLKADDESKIILEDAKQEVDEIKQRSLDSIAEERERLKEETRIHIIEIASLMAEKYITQNIDDEAQDRLLEEALAQMEDTQWQS